jgi:hypothetical protein
MEHEFLVGKRFLVLNLMVQILDPVRSSTFFVRVGVFKIQVPTFESMFIISNHAFFISVLSTKNDIFVLIICAFPKVAILNPILNPILILVISLLFSTIDSSPLEAVVSWNQ